VKRKNSYRLRYGAPSKGRFRWLAANPDDEIPAYGRGVSYSIEEQLQHARIQARSMARVFAKRHPGGGWVVGVFRGRKLVERFPGRNEA